MDLERLLIHRELQLTRALSQPKVDRRYVSVRQRKLEEARRAMVKRRKEVEGGIRVANL